MIETDIFQYLQNGGSMASGVALLLIWRIEKRLGALTERIDNLYNHPHQKKRSHN